MKKVDSEFIKNKSRGDLRENSPSKSRMEKNDKGALSSMVSTPS